MKGLAVMVLVALAVFYLAQMYVGTLFGAVIAIILFVLWGRLNLYHGTMGLIRSNLRTYFLAVRRGLEPSEAIEFMVKTRRYPSRDWLLQNSPLVPFSVINNFFDGYNSSPQVSCWQKAHPAYLRSWIYLPQYYRR